jgi:hypothetical protein
MKTITMKKTIAIALVALGLQLSLNSCSKDDSPAPEPTPTPALVLLKKAINTNGNYNTTSTITYNGNKIVEINSTRTGQDSGTGKIVFTYTGDLITKVTEYNNGVLSDQTDYTYENNKLKSYVLIEGGGQYKSKGVYIYNPDGTVTRESYSIDIATGVETNNDRDKVMTFANGNLVKEVEISNYYDSNGVLVSTSKYTETYEYDTKNSPFKNILGFNIYFDDPYEMTQTNNMIKRTVLQESINNGQAQEPSTYIYTRTYEYNSNGYPIKEEGDVKSDSGITQFFYE